MTSMHARICHGYTMYYRLGILSSIAQGILQPTLTGTCATPQLIMVLDLGHDKFEIK